MEFFDENKKNTISGASGKNKKMVTTGRFLLSEKESKGVKLYNDMWSGAIPQTDENIREMMKIIEAESNKLMRGVGLSDCEAIVTQNTDVIVEILDKIGEEGIRSATPDTVIKLLEEADCPPAMMSLFVLMFSQMWLGYNFNDFCLSAYVTAKLPDCGWATWVSAAMTLLSVGIALGMQVGKANAEGT